MADEEKGTGYVRQMYVDAIKQVREELRSY